MLNLEQVHLEQLKLIRKETHNGYTYSLYKRGNQFLVVSKYHNGPITAKVIEDIDTKLVVSQELIEYINSHANIYNDSDKFIWKWRQ